MRNDNYPFVLADFDEEDLMLFFNAAIKPITDDYIFLNETSVESFEYQLIYFSFLIYIGEVFPSKKARQYPRKIKYRSKSYPEILEKPLLERLPYPDLVALGRELNLGIIGEYLFSNLYSHRAHWTWTEILMKDLPCTRNEKIYVYGGDNAHLYTILKEHHAGPRKGGYSIITIDKIAYAKKDDKRVRELLEDPMTKMEGYGLNPYSYAASRVFKLFISQLQDN